MQAPRVRKPKRQGAHPPKSRRYRFYQGGCSILLHFALASSIPAAHRPKVLYAALPAIRPLATGILILPRDSPFLHRPWQWHGLLFPWTGGHILLPGRSVWPFGLPSPLGGSKL